MADETNESEAVPTCVLQPTIVKGELRSTGQTGDYSILCFQVTSFVQPEGPSRNNVIFSSSFNYCMNPEILDQDNG
ncbi:hypothetical protein Dimus_031232 [Dionaea muscipula]